MKIYNVLQTLLCMHACMHTLRDAYIPDTIFNIFKEMPIELDWLFT